MSTAQTLPHHAAKASTDDGLVHVACCLADVALCDGHQVDPPDETLPDTSCVVCLDLEENAHHACPVRARCIQWEETA